MRNPSEQFQHSSQGERQLRLIRKELRETLRDRRTLTTLIVMPLIVYPLLGLVFQRFLLRYTRVADSSSGVRWVVGVESEQSMHALHSLLLQGDILLKAHDDPQKREALLQELRATSGTQYQFVGGASIEYSLHHTDPISAVSRGAIDAAVTVRGGLKPQAQPTISGEIVFRSTSATSLGAVRFLEERLQALNRSFLLDQLRRERNDVPLPISFAARSVADQMGQSLSLNALIPLVLILMTITGAVYPAIDLTAGERERGTLEPLIAAPIPRFMLLFAKYVAVVTVAILTGMINMLGMGITIWSSGLTHLIGGESTSLLGIVVQTIGLLILFSAFFSAVLLVVTTFSRSFKEAQAYLIPLMLISLAPGIASLMPDLEYTPPMALVPLLNMVLLSRDLLAGQAQPLTAVLAVGCTGLYSVAAIGLASRFFGTDAVLYGSLGSWNDWLRRPTGPQTALGMDIAMIWLACLFPMYYSVSHLNARWSGNSPTMWLSLAAIATTLLFGLSPIAVLRYFRVPLAEGLRWRVPAIGFAVAGVILGLSLWPLALEILLRTLPTELQEILASDAGIWKQMSERLGALRHVSTPLILLSMAVTPAICEEISFRGFLLGSFEKRLPPWQAIILSAVLFGSFHVVMGGMLFLERLLPSTLLGLVLGWLAIRSRSLVPGMLLHAVHNGFMMVAGQRMGWSMWETISQQGHVPWPWLGAALLATGLGLGIAEWSSRRRTS